MSGFGLMTHALNNIVVDYQEKQARLAELDRLQQQSEDVSQMTAPSSPSR